MKLKSINKKIRSKTNLLKNILKVIRMKKKLIWKLYKNKYSQWISYVQDWLAVRKIKFLFCSQAFQFSCKFSAGWFQPKLNVKSKILHPLFNFWLTTVWTLIYKN